MLGKAGPNHLGLHPAAEVRTEVLPDLRHALRGGVEAVVGVLDVADVVQWGAGGGGCGGGGKASVSNGYPGAVAYDMI